MIESGNELFESYGKEITCIYGESATGKTTLAKMAAISEARKGNKVVYVDTENGFNLERVKQLAGGNFEKVLENILVFRANRFREQNRIIKSLKDMKNISLIVIDTIGKHYRIGVKNKPEIYNPLMNIQFNILSDLAREIPVVITNQVYTNIVSKETVMVGGDMFKNWSKRILKLEKGPGRVIFEKPEGEGGGVEVGFEIKEMGIQKTK